MASYPYRELSQPAARVHVSLQLFYCHIHILGLISACNFVSMSSELQAE